jgi:hypothetical protein
MENGLQTDRNGELIWYTDGSKTNIGTGAGVYGHGLGHYMTALKANMYGIKPCVDIGARSWG